MSSRYDPTGVQHLVEHYQCCLSGYRWCSRAKRQRVDRGLKRGKRPISYAPELGIAEVKADLDYAIGRLRPIENRAIRLLISKGPGWRDWPWWDRHARDAGLTVSGLKKRVRRACRRMARTLGWIPEKSSVIRSAARHAARRMGEMSATT